LLQEANADESILDAYAEHVLSFVDASAMRPLTIVADTANGMGGLVAPAVLERLPVTLHLLYGELDGTFPNHPADPLVPANLVDLKAAVLEHGADIGLAFDGDADRVFLIDEQAEGVSGSLTTALVSVPMLRHEPGAKVVHNLICSWIVPETIRAHGGEPVRTRVGHSFIKQVMAETDAIFGGEHSAHYYFRDNWRADSGSIAALLVLEQLCRADAPLSELRKPFERYVQSGEINSRVDDPAATIDRIAGEYTAANQDRLDGLTVDAGDWWFNLRPSNTEPLLRLNLEAADRASCDAHTDEVLTLIRAESQEK
jgi:phosphomannomutase